MIHSAVGTGWPVRPGGACRSDRRYLGSLTEQTSGGSRFQIVFVKFLDFLMFMTSRWFLFVCDIVVC